MKKRLRGDFSKQDVNETYQEDESRAVVLAKRSAEANLLVDIHLGNHTMLSMRIPNVKEMSMSMNLDTYETVFHVTTWDGVANSILNFGINPRFFNDNSRYGKAFYVSMDVNACFTELEHHGCVPAEIIAFRMPKSKFHYKETEDNSVVVDHLEGAAEIDRPQIGDLTVPYARARVNPEYEGTVALANNLKRNGYKGVKFYSERHAGAVNFALFFGGVDRGDYLKPQGVISVPQDVRDQSQSRINATIQPQQP